MDGLVTGYFDKNKNLKKLGVLIFTSLPHPRDWRLHCSAKTVFERVTNNIFCTNRRVFREPLTALIHIGMETTSVTLAQNKKSCYERFSRKILGLRIFA